MGLTARRLRINALRRQRTGLESRLMGRPKEMLEGPLIERYAPCGKENCKCKKRGSKGHGPYYYTQIKVKDKYKNVYLGGRADLIELAGNYSRYLKGIVSLRKINREIDRLLEEINRSRIRKGVK
ncbi:MAG: DUF6788 family protein [Candidatus Margulisiibacteriota bacterium]